MKTETQVSLFIAAGFLFIITGLLADDWTLRLIWPGLGMLTLLAGVLAALRGKRDQ